MSVRYELFATGAAPPDQVWALVGDPRRLDEWTDLGTLVRVEPDQSEPAVGMRVVLTAGQTTTAYEVTTVEQRLWELRTPRTGIGVRVVPDPLGSRLILAGYHETDGALDSLRARLLEAPRMRGRFDRWAERALRATGPPADS